MIKRNILTKEGYIINKQDYTNNIIENLKSELTVTPNINQEFISNTESFKVYKETSNELIIPRYYGIKKFGIPDNHLITNQINYKFTGSLRENQISVVETALQKIKSQGGGILQLYTGFGKTTISLYIASILKLKTLVVVHKTFLQDQWYERIKQFTDAKIGIIRQKKTDVENKDIIVGMLQSISMIDYDPKIFEDIDLIICDECFIGETLVVTDNKFYTIEELYKLWLNKNKLPLVKSYNEKLKKFEYKQILHVSIQFAKIITSIDIDKVGNIMCTTNHKFLTNKGYIEANNINSYKLICNKLNNSEIVETNILTQKLSKYHKFYIVYDIEVEDNHNYIITKNKQYGAIVHNCHHVASRVFSRVLLKVGAKYTIGLSATPKRNDGLTKVIKWFLGDILVHVERNYDNSVFVKYFEYNSDNILFAEKKRWIQGQMKPDTVKMITNIHNIEDRNKFISNIINHLRKKEHRKILVLSGRINHLKKLKVYIDNLILEDIKNNICFEEEYKTGFYVGNMREYELKESMEADIIFATYAMAEEGLDIIGLNTLILATPKKNIIQSIGRIMRKPIEECDINPLIIDICDNISVFGGWGKLRGKYYKSNKYSLFSYKAFNDKIISFKDYILNCGILDKTLLDKSDINIRKEYLIKILGDRFYELEKKKGFPNYPDKIFNYSCNMDEIFNV